MSDSRKRAGIGAMITGILFVGFGVALFSTEVTPDWVATIVTVVGTIAEVLGFKVVLPEE